MSDIAREPIRRRIIQLAREIATGIRFGAKTQGCQLLIFYFMFCAIGTRAFRPLMLV